VTKEEAISAMRDGKKVKHAFFTPDEWVKESGDGYEFEDGCRCEIYEFWLHRIDDSWNNCWSIVVD